MGTQFDELKFEQAEKLLVRAADLFNEAFLYNDDDYWLRRAGRWISDYERRDEWIDGRDHQD